MFESKRYMSLTVLPNEVLQEIWPRLALADRVSVFDVCTKLRLSSLSSPVFLSCLSTEKEVLRAQQQLIRLASTPVKLITDCVRADIEQPILNFVLAVAARLQYLRLHLLHETSWRNLNVALSAETRLEQLWLEGSPTAASFSRFPQCPWRTLRAVSLPTFPPRGARFPKVATAHLDIHGHDSFSDLSEALTAFLVVVCLRLGLASTEHEGWNPADVGTLGLPSTLQRLWLHDLAWLKYRLSDPPPLRFFISYRATATFGVDLYSAASPVVAIDTCGYIFTRTVTRDGTVTTYTRERFGGAFFQDVPPSVETVRVQQYDNSKASPFKSLPFVRTLEVDCEVTSLRRGRLECEPFSKGMSCPSLKTLTVYGPRRDPRDLWPHRAHGRYEVSDGSIVEFITSLVGASPSPIDLRILGPSLCRTGWDELDHMTSSIYVGDGLQEEPWCYKTSFDLEWSYDFMPRVYGYHVPFS